MIMKHKTIITSPQSIFFIQISNIIMIKIKIKNDKPKKLTSMQIIQPRNFPLKQRHSSLCVAGAASSINTRSAVASTSPCITKEIN